MLIFAIISSLILILWGILALTGLIIGKAPDMKDQFDKVIPYQGVIWVILLLLGVRDLLFIFDILLAFKYGRFSATIRLLTLFTKLVLWFVLSFWLITKYVLTIDPSWTAPKKWAKKSRSKKTKTADAERKQKTTQTYETLTKVQVPFGVVAIVIGVLALILNIIGLFV